MLTAKQAFWAVIMIETGLESMNPTSLAHQKAREAGKILWEAYCEGECPA